MSIGSGWSGYLNRGQSNFFPRRENLHRPHLLMKASDASPNSRWWWLAIPVVMVAASVGVDVFDRYAGPTVYDKPGLRFTVGSCERSADIPGIEGPKGAQNPGIAAEGIRSRTWRPDGTLVLETVLIENCITPPIEGDFAIKGNTISLSYRLTPPPVHQIQGKVVPMLAACNCPYRLTYEIAGIPRADYRIDFPASGKGLP